MIERHTKSKETVLGLLRQGWRLSARKDTTGRRGSGDFVAVTCTLYDPRAAERLGGATPSIVRTERELCAELADEGMLQLVGSSGGVRTYKLAADAGL